MAGELFLQIVKIGARQRRKILRLYCDCFCDALKIQGGVGFSWDQRPFFAFFAFFCALARVLSGLFFLSYQAKPASTNAKDKSLSSRETRPIILFSLS